MPYHERRRDRRSLGYRIPSNAPNLTQVGAFGMSGGVPVHQDIETREVIRITDETTKAELEEAITSHRATLGRMPSHWAERRAALHAKIDALLEDWERAPDPRTADAQAG